MKKIKSYDKFIKSKFNPKPSKKTYGWNPDPKVKVTKVKEEIDFKKALAGAALGTGLALSNPTMAIQAETPVSTQQQVDSVDTPDTYKQRISEISNLRQQKSKDEKLNSILLEIQSKMNSEDSSQFIKLFTELKLHLEDNYGYVINDKQIEQHIKSENIIETVKNMSLFEILGWLGSICLAICGVPQAWQSYKDKNSDGISWGFILLWAFGELFALAYVYDKLDLPLLLNYATNILILAVILYYKVKPGQTNSFINESVESPGPNIPGSTSIKLNQDQINLISEEPELQELIADQKICLLPPMVWYKEDDKDTLEILKSYIQ